MVGEEVLCCDDEGISRGRSLVTEQFQSPMAAHESTHVTNGIEPNTHFVPMSTSWF